MASLTGGWTFALASRSGLHFRGDRGVFVRHGQIGGAQIRTQVEVDRKVVDADDLVAQAIAPLDAREFGRVDQAGRVRALPDLVDVTAGQRPRREAAVTQRRAHARLQRLCVYRRL